MQSTHGKSSFCKKLRGALRRAFTITELVIVIAVIAILAAILIPTFSNVIESANKSHDEQFVKEINIALSGYEAENDRAPEDYEELMLYLADYGLCDASNPFLLATGLKQDGNYLVWYSGSTSVALVNTSDYILQWNTSGDTPNSVIIYDKGNVSAQNTMAYVLCTDGDGRTEGAADYFYDYFIASGGDINQFLDQFEDKYSSGNIENVTSDKNFQQSIIASMNNQRFGYAYSQSTANSLLQQAGGGSNLSIGISSDEVISEAGGVTLTQKGAQAVRSGLATLATLANTSDSAETMAGKTISFVEAENGDELPLEGAEVDMSQVQMMAIGTTYRKNYESATVTDLSGNEIKLPEVNTSSFSVNFQGLTLSGMKISDSTYLASAGEYQDQGDNGYTGGAFSFAYGLFGTINAEKGQTVTISNLTIKDVNVDLNDGEVTASNGQKYDAVSDMAGVVAGYTQGNVVFKNITVDGVAVDGKISGYDGVSALVGRAYAKSKNDPASDTATLTIEDCHVNNLQVLGQRRAAGFIAYAGVNIKVVIKDSSLTDVEIISQRKDGQTSNMFVGVFGHFANTTTLTVEDVTLENVSCTAQYFANTSEGWKPITEIVRDDNHFLDYCYYLNSGSNYLPLVYIDKVGGAVGTAAPTTVTNLTIKGFDGSDYTLASGSFGGVIDEANKENDKSDITSMFTKA